MPNRPRRLVDPLRAFLAAETAGAALPAIAAVVALGVAMWWFTREAGVHATIAGVAMGLLTPARAPEGGSEGEGPSRAEQLARVLHPWTSLVIVPLFALANTGLDLTGARCATPPTPAPRGASRSVSSSANPWASSSPSSERRH